MILTTRRAQDRQPAPDASHPRSVTVERYLLVASLGGAPRHPIWYLNLVDNPAGDRPGPGRGAPAASPHGRAPEEKAELWPLAVGQWPEYDDYQARTDRDIPLVICEPEAERIVGGRGDL